MGVWIMEVYLVNDPEQNADKPVFDTLLDFETRKSMGMENGRFPNRRSAEDWLKIFSNNGRKIPGDFLLNLYLSIDDFPTGEEGVDT